MACWQWCCVRCTFWGLRTGTGEVWPCLLGVCGCVQKACMQKPGLCSVLTKPASVIHWVGVWFIFHGCMSHVGRACLCGKAKRDGKVHVPRLGWHRLPSSKGGGRAKRGCLDVTNRVSSGTEREAFDLQIILSTLQPPVIVQVSYRAAHLEH